MRRRGLRCAGADRTASTPTLEPVGVRFVDVVDLSRGVVVAARPEVTLRSPAGSLGWDLGLIPRDHRRRLVTDVDGTAVSAVLDAVLSRWPGSLARRARQRLLVESTDVFAPGAGAPRTDRDRRQVTDALTAVLDRHGVRPYELIVEMPAGSVTACRRTVRALEAFVAAGTRLALSGHGSGPDDPDPATCHLPAGTVVFIDPRAATDGDVHRRRAVLRRLVEPLHEHGYLSAARAVTDPDEFGTLLDVGVRWADGPLFDYRPRCIV